MILTQIWTFTWDSVTQTSHRTYIPTCKTCVMRSQYACWLLHSYKIGTSTYDGHRYEILIIGIHTIHDTYLKHKQLVFFYLEFLREYEYLPSNDKNQSKYRGEKVEFKISFFIISNYNLSSVLGIWNDSCQSIHPSVHPSIHPSINQPARQSVNQSVNQSINQSDSQSVSQPPTNQPTNQPINQPTTKLTNQPTNQSVIHSSSESVCPSICPPISQIINKSQSTFSVQLQIAGTKRTRSHLPFPVKIFKIPLLWN